MDQHVARDQGTLPRPIVVPEELRRRRLVWRPILLQHLPGTLFRGLGPIFNDRLDLAQRHDVAGTVLGLVLPLGLVLHGVRRCPGDGCHTLAGRDIRGSSISLVHVIHLCL